MAEQESAAKSGNELSKIVQWAGDLSSKAQQALADLQRSVEGFTGQASKDDDDTAAASTPPPSPAPKDISATIKQLEIVSASIRDSNERFDRQFPRSDPADDGSGPNSSLDQAAAALLSAPPEQSGEAAVRSRQEYLKEFVASMEEAEERMRREEAERAAAAALERERAERATAEAAAKEAEAALAAEVAAAAVAAAAAESAALAPAIVKVDVAVRCCTQPGQSVCLVGSHPALGSWNADSALALAWTEGHVWRASIEVDPSECSRIEYKAILKCADGPAIWEGGADKSADLEEGAADLSLAYDFTPAGWGA